MHLVLLKGCAKCTILGIKWVYSTLHLFEIIAIIFWNLKGYQMKVRAQKVAWSMVMVSVVFRFAQNLYVSKQIHNISCKYS